MMNRFIDEKLSKLKEAIKNWKWLNFYIKQDKKYYIVIILINIITISIGLILSLLSKELIDIVIGHKDNLIVKVISVVLFLTILRVLLGSINRYLNIRLRINFKTKLRTIFFNKIINVKWKQIDKYHSADITNRIEGDINGVCIGAVSIIPTIITTAFKFIAIMVIILVNDPIMALLTFISAPVMFFTSYFLMHRISKYNKELRETNSDILRVNQETFQNNTIVKVFDMDYQYLNNMKLLLNKYKDITTKESKILIAIGILLSFVSIFVSYLCFGYSIYCLWQGKITFGTLTLFLSLAGMLRTSFSTLVNQLPAIVKTSIYIERIKEILELEEDKKEGTSVGSIKSIEANNMYFSYKDNNDYELKDINFKIKKGEIIGLIGSTGEGKTTLIRLLLGLVKPSNGKLLFKFKGSLLQASADTRTICSYVPQENNIFSGTIKDNLRLAKKDATKKEMNDVLKKAEIYDHVYSLKDNIDTVLSEDAGNFSLGQRQRIAIARALLKDSQVIIFDEATSALDLKTEKKIIENIKNSKHSDKIIIISTHRPSTLKIADRIFSIEKHRLIEK